MFTEKQYSKKSDVLVVSETQKSEEQLFDTQSRRLLYFDIAKEIARATTTDDLREACRASANLLGYEYYLFGGYYPDHPNCLEKYRLLRR